MYFQDLPFGVMCGHPDMGVSFVRVNGSGSSEQILLYGVDHGELASIFQFVSDPMDDDNFGVVNHYGELEK